MTTDSPEYLTPAEVCALLPRRRRGKMPAIATIYRWMSPGCRGVRLRYVQIGGTRCTTREWMDDFFGSLTRLSAEGSPSAAAPSNTGLAGRTTAARQRAFAKAEREADALGV